MLLVLLPVPYWYSILYLLSQLIAVIIHLCMWYVQKLLAEHGEVRLSGLGVAMGSLVTVAEMMKSKGMAVEKTILTSLEDLEVEAGNAYVCVCV